MNRVLGFMAFGIVNILAGMNRDIYSGGNVSGLRKSRIVFRVIGVVLILYGLAVAAISFRLLLLLEQSSRGSH
jgi:hypothetical protein